METELPQPVSVAGQAIALRQVGRAHKWGAYLYEVVRGGVVVAKISATPADAVAMLSGMERAGRGKPPNPAADRPAGLG